MQGSISNNLPATEFSVGDDTALNTIIDAVDKIRQSAVSSSKVFVVEVMGTGGYLVLFLLLMKCLTCKMEATMTTMATGADKTYISEKRITLSGLQTDCDYFARAFKEHPDSSILVINNEKSRFLLFVQCNSIFLTT
jgi:6-phosphofructokinase 1